MTESAATIRAFERRDAETARELFIRVNRQLAPAAMADAFEAYIARSLAEEIDRILDYYGERQGGFWVAEANGRLLGMFGLEPASPCAMELRRMYVDPTARRNGIARAMLWFAEDECRRRGILRLALSTSELQPAAIALYRASGYVLVREETAEIASNKTIGGGIRRFHFAKSL